MNTFDAQQRAQVRIDRRVELRAAMNEIEGNVKRAIWSGSALIKDEIDVALATPYICGQNGQFIRNKRIDDSLFKGGCGDVEDTVCKPDSANYNAANCRACQDAYIALRDADVESRVAAFREEDLGKSPPADAESINAFYDNSMNDMKQFCRKVLPTLLQNTNGG